MEDEAWGQVRITKELMKWIDEFVESPEGKKQGFTSRSQVVASATRDMLKEEMKKKKAKG